MVSARENDNLPASCESLCTLDCVQIGFGARVCETDEVEVEAGAEQSGVLRLESAGSA